MTDLVHSGFASIPGGYEADGATMLERAARAAALADGVLPECDSWVDYFPITRAVLMAVREPDEVAILDGERAAWDDTNSMPAIRAMPKAWRAMIDAILADGEGR